MGGFAHRIIFVTGTDTGVGKTILTALLVAHLRRENVPAYALKPFCSGNRRDAKLLYGLQDGDLKLAEINPFFFPQPLAPLAAARALGEVPLRTVVAYLTSFCSKLKRGSLLLIEGVGGLLVPLGKGYSVLDLILALQCEVIIVAANKLGTINHTMLSTAVLRHGKPSGTKSRRLKIVLMNVEKRDLSSRSNTLILRDLLKPVPCIEMPFLGKKAAALPAIQDAAKKLKKTLARILE